MLYPTRTSKLVLVNHLGIDEARSCLNLIIVRDTMFRRYMAINKYVYGYTNIKLAELNFRYSRIRPPDNNKLEKRPIYKGETEFLTSLQEEDRTFELRPENIYP